MDLADCWPLSDGGDIRERLEAAYADPSRGYHDLRHLAEVCSRVEELIAAGVACDRLAVLLAAWFHDAVYDGERDAEERSAAWAEDDLPALVTDPATVAEVARLVRLTETHHPEEQDLNGCALSDADLAILAAPRDRYDEYAADVRRDYAHLPDEVFRAGRTAVLRDLLGRTRLFHTAYGHSTWDGAARANIIRELDTLTGQS